MTVAVSPGKPEHTARYARFFAEVFARDAVTQRFFPQGTDARPYLTAQFTAMLNAMVWDCGCVDVALDSDTGELLGAAMWVAPNPRPQKVKTLRQIPLWIKGIPSVRALPRLVRQNRIFAQAKPKRPHWLLSEIAVADAARGRGVGSQLLRYRLEHIDADPEMVYLEATTAASARLYERHGFQHREALAIDGVTCHTMIRPPRGREPREN